MGSDAHVIVNGPAALLDQAAARIDDLERRWSRFLPDSEISRLNRGAGAPMVVSPETRLLVERAREAWALTAGMFDPTILGSLVRAGYDRSFDELEPEVEPPTSPLRAGAEDIEVGEDTVRLPDRTGFDPGGIGKGLAADIVAAEVIDAGAAGVCINLGGDVRVAGVSAEVSGGWTISVDHAWSDQPLVLVGVSDGAVATSTTLLRRWQQAGRAQHHLIDPHTGLPSDTDVNHVTVIASEGWAAEVLAKAVLLRGSAHPFDILGGTGADALVVTAGGLVLASPGFARFADGRPIPARIEPPPGAAAREPAPI